MNPARSLGPAIVTGHYKGLWIYIIGPTLGAIFGAWTYNLMKLTNNHGMKNKTIYFWKRIVFDLLIFWFFLWRGESIKEISDSQKIIEVSSKDKVICKCSEGWTCIVTKTEEPEAGNIFFDCGDEGCLCIIDETNTLKKHVLVYDKTKRRKGYKMYI